MLASALAVAGCDKKKGPAPSSKVKITQKLCPVMGQPIDENIYVDYKGRRVYFCCQACVKAFNKEPEKYIKKLDEPRKKETTPPAGGSDTKTHGGSDTKAHGGSDTKPHSH